MTESTESRAGRPTFWALTAFYCLVAFEVAYMASPFALYFYAVYRPGIGTIASSPTLSWLSFFFLPHIVVDTKSAFLDARTAIGVFLFLTGFAAFLVCAVQLYASKLRRRGAVTGLAYGTIRHPQYVALAVSSLGLLILWPRYLALLLYVAMLAAYYLLARIEERECLRRFGAPYEEYLRRTPRFVPYAVPFVERLPSLPPPGPRRVVALAGVFAVAALLGLGAAHWLRRISVDRLYTASNEDTIFLSVGAIDDAILADIVRIASSDERLRSAMVAAASPGATRFIAYVLPTGWFVSEIPMKRPPGAGGHHAPTPTDPSRFRVVLTRASLRGGQEAEGDEILLRAVTTTAVVEALVDVDAGAVCDVEGPLERSRYEGIPVPVF